MKSKTSLSYNDLYSIQKDLLDFPLNCEGENIFVIAKPYRLINDFVDI